MRNIFACRVLLLALIPVFGSCVSFTVPGPSVALRRFSASEQGNPAPDRAEKRLAQERQWRREGPETGGMVRISGGTFTMGSPAQEWGRDKDETQYSVVVSSFLMGKRTVTQGEWRQVMGTSPGYFRGDDLPVEQVNWFGAVEYCNRQSQREGFTPAYTINGRTVTWNRQANGYRLPTEAEWEYACRAGTLTPFSTGNTITAGQSNYNGNYPYTGNEKGTNRQRTTPAGDFPPNGWGLFDMHGNVWEWCWDWYADYPHGTQTDPAGREGNYRVTRGGSWDSPARSLRSANRSYSNPADRDRFLGFRLVRNAP